MKKLLSVLAAAFIFVGAAATSVSAAEHEVQKGESLWGIANEYNTTVDELVHINNLKTVVLQPKQVLTINEENGDGDYIVEEGDTLSGIADLHGVTVGNLMKWNSLNTSLIVVGQELNINGAAVKESAKQAPAEQKTASKQVKAPAATDKAQEQEQKPAGKTISVTATAYTAKCDGCSGVTYTGVDLNKNPNAKVIAVDPNVIPLGSKVHVEGYGYATAADIGGAIKGNKIDLHVPTKDEAYSWGVRTVNVTIVN